jgi:hypothetical protein
VPTVVFNLEINQIAMAAGAGNFRNEVNLSDTDIQVDGSVDSHRAAIGLDDIEAGRRAPRRGGFNLRAELKGFAWTEERLDGIQLADTETHKD